MIKAQNLGVRFVNSTPDESWVFRHVDFTLNQGQALVIVGPSGSGKTVMLKTLVGLISPTEGLSSLGSDDVGMLFQKNALFDSMTVEQNLLFPLRERRGTRGIEARKIAQRWLDQVGLDGTQALFPHELSGGMQKRLGIARALIVEPKIIVYDEPTAGLDPITSENIAELIDGLRKNQGSTLIAVTGDIPRATQLGDLISLLALGCLSTPLTPDAFLASTDPSIHQFSEGLTEGPLSAGRAIK